MIAPPAQPEESNTLPHDFVWSERGPVCDYGRTDSLPFENVAILGRTGHAQVDSVKCKGIILARKQILWTGRIPREEIQREIFILQKLDHRHVIRYVGSYTQGRVIAILLHPAAALDLGRRLRTIDDEKSEGTGPCNTTIRD
ncbi:hypothetical protein CC86DRAFT_103056 [Ophiobolus disseminans]|uniref:Protein kinase domain-containing protein n=1 Tax=Ophiobolus disseminans TaxID=1469910 RepID=A0A6A6ZM87_9PLEO|nr:hypothetical protein CC86DRAFT_103056 [Ophiobolus disseminans]